MVKGVVVVCSGADNPVVQQNIIDAVTTALDITSVKVCNKSKINIIGTGGAVYGFRKAAAYFGGFSGCLRTAVYLNWQFTGNDDLLATNAVNSEKISAKHSW